MRPIVLDLNGFASFREAASVDFTDADFFALVGPTGSGKSTVIDAMTFALYGSVPRWGRKGMVSLALAPTIDRATVKLVFEVQGQRYVVARELRRVGGQVSQRNASLERLADAGGLAKPGEPTEVLAKDPAGVTDAVERLLGLSYDDFCQCVVLPQGQFANFLHAKPRDRQEILLRLLGAEHFRQMMMRANQRATSAAQRADTLAETLMTLGDATQDAQDAAEAAEAGLSTLKERAEAALPEVHEAGKALESAEAELARIDGERAALAAVRVPDDVVALDTTLTAVRSAVEHARVEQSLAEGADSAARDALARGPQRAPLELARQRRADHAEHLARVPSLQGDLARLSGSAAQVQERVSQAAAVLEGLRATRDAAARAAEAAQQRTAELGADHALLSAVAAPKGVDQLDDSQQAATDAERDASALLQAAEQADSEARAARSSAVAPGPLEHALRDLSDLGTLIADMAGGRARLGQARAAREAADSALASAEEVSHQSQRELDDARRANVVADLRPHLVPGHACPVCEQTVRTLPAALDTPGIDQARARSDEAVAAVAAARSVAAAAASAHDKARSELESHAVQRARRVASLTTATAGPLASASLTATADVLGQEASRTAAATQASQAAVAAEERQARQVATAISELEGALRERRDLEAAAEAAGAAVESARALARSALALRDQAAADSSAARGALSGARDPLVGLGAPSVEDVSLAAGWARLCAWACDAAAARAAELTGAQAVAVAASAELARTQQEFGQAEMALSRLRAEATVTARAEQEAQTRLAELTARIAELSEQLLGAPDDKQVTDQLALLATLEAAASQADQRLLGARTERASQEHALGDLELAEAAALRLLSVARDPLVMLGAPALDVAAAGLLASWTDLAMWAAAQASARVSVIAAAAERVTAGRASIARLTGQLSAELISGGIDLEPGAVAARALTSVATALERARSASARITERRAQAAGLIARRDTELGKQQVARMLGDLLRSDQFPKWLVTAAIDVLVADASVNLAGLSDGQFDLTHEDGDFYVIDHADADSRRSVRTLSGGETFQASLALALALSSQLTGLAAAGTARLDSIFLDEGFGTLDPETLDVVAATLETLAQGQRMVGIITHVTALAERVPVRFAVSRDARTSTVVREGVQVADVA